MSEEHIPIPEGWLDPQFRGGAGPEFDPVSMAYPALIPPGGPVIGPGMKPAGVAGMVRAGEMAAPILAPVTTPGGLITPGSRGGATVYRKPSGSSPDGPLIHAADAWVGGAITAAARSEHAGLRQPLQSGKDDWSTEVSVNSEEEGYPVQEWTDATGWDLVPQQASLARHWPPKWPPDWWPKWGVIPIPSLPLPHGVPFPYFPGPSVEELQEQLDEWYREIGRLERELGELARKYRDLLRIRNAWKRIQDDNKLGLDAYRSGNLISDPNELVRKIARELGEAADSSGMENTLGQRGGDYGLSDAELDQLARDMMDGKGKEWVDGWVRDAKRDAETKEGHVKAAREEASRLNKRITGD